ncbi:MULTISPECIES: hypothetical protein [unclassified Pseudomonas]|jgi:hypothetical protein|uniref:hypothetical protein n=1 Tax=unclassified Pseudomonas TaxID=196821 RepID=UPI0009E60D8D|nr:MULTISPECIES: hypothetical protein [unclassified Pseudomonas]
MGTIVHFVGKDDLSAQENLNRYIEHARKNTPFANVEWEDNIWDITTFVIGRAQGKTKKLVYFRSLKDKSGNKPLVQIPLDPCFMDFAKSAFSETMRRLRLVEYNRHLGVLRVIEQALIDFKLKPCITKLTPFVLDRAAEILREKFQDAWPMGRVLERVVTEIVNPARLTPVILEWRSPFEYKQPVRNDRVSTKDAEKSTSRLPSLESILALADIHHKSKAMPDRVATAFVTLAMYAPSRASEILSLPVNCIRRADTKDGPIMGIAWAPAKGAMPMTKFAASDEFEAIIESTVRYLAELGAPARKAAEWYLNNPKDLYLPPGTEHLRGSPITLKEVSQILGKETAIQTSHAKRGYGLVATGEVTNDRSRMQDSRKTGLAPLYEFDSLERYVLGKLPAIFPILDGHTKIKWHEALFVLPTNVLRPDGETLLYLPSPISTNQINHQLGTNPSGVTVFTRNSKANPDGSPMGISTHAFRHLLNTLAQSKHLSEALIAFWSGRKNISQNEWYDHLPQEVFIEAYLKLGDVGKPLQVAGQLEAKVRSIEVTHGLTREEALKLELGATHRTRYGICRHDHALTPCPKDKDCVSCGEHTFVKGEQRHLDEAEFQFKMHEKAVADAQKAVEEGEPGAARWLKLHLPKLERWKLVLEMLNDPSIPDGTLLTLPPPDQPQSKAGLAQAVRIINQAGPSTNLAKPETETDADEKLLLDMGFF